MKKLLLLGFAVLLFDAAAFGQQDVKIADKQFDNGEYVLALQNYLQEVSGQNYTLHNCLQIARCFDALGLSDKSYHWYQKTHTLFPEETAFGLELGKAMMKMEKYDEAILAFENYTAVDPALGNHFAAMCRNIPHVISSEGSTDRYIAFKGNQLSNEFGPIIYRDRVYVNTDVKNARLNSHAIKTTGIGGGIILCDDKGYPLLKGMGTMTNISPIAISQNNTIAYCSNTRQCQAMASRKKSSTLYIGKLVQNEIEGAKPFPFNAVGVSITDPYLTPDGQTLYFSSDMPGGFGGFDLYSSQLMGGEWTQPMNLGTEINTPGNEVTPFIDDNNYLYFASDYHFGLGGLDLFRAQYFMDGWFNPVNLGKGINSSDNDYHPFVDSDNQILFTSNRMKGQGGEDIYRATIPAREITAAFDISPILVNDDMSSLALEQKRAEVQDAPPAVYIGEYNRRSANTNVEAIPVSQRSDKKIVSAEKYDMNTKTMAVIPDQKVDDLIPPPVFKIPEMGADKSKGGTLVNYTGAKLVSINEVITKPINSVYFIQLAAFYSSSGNMNNFKMLSTFGNIYKVFKDRAIKVRLGYFYDHGDAATVLQKVRDRGFKDAFLVNDDLNTSNMELIYSNHSKTPPAASNGPAATETPVIDNMPAVQYKVRLASYEDPIWFDSSNIKDLGQLEQWSKGAWTIFILSGYADYEAAEAARIKAVNRGYTDAEVVIDNQGIIERLKKN